MKARTAKSIAARCSHIQLSTGAAPGAAFDHKASLRAKALQPLVILPSGDVGAMVPVEIGGFSVKHGRFLSPFRGPMIAGARGLVPSSPRAAGLTTRGEGALGAKPIRLRAVVEKRAAIFGQGKGGRAVVAFRAIGVNQIAAFVELKPIGARRAKGAARPLRIEERDGLAGHDNLAAIAVPNL